MQGAAQHSRDGAADGSQAGVMTGSVSAEHIGVRRCMSSRRAEAPAPAALLLLRDSVAGIGGGHVCMHDRVAVTIWTLAAAGGLGYRCWRCSLHRRLCTWTPQHHRPHGSCAGAAGEVSRAGPSRLSKLGAPLEDGPAAAAAPPPARPPGGSPRLPRTSSAGPEWRQAFEQISAQLRVRPRPCMAVTREPPAQSRLYGAHASVGPQEPPVHMRDVMQASCVAVYTRACLLVWGCRGPTPLWRFALACYGSASEGSLHSTQQAHASRPERTCAAEADAEADVSYAGSALYISGSARCKRIRGMHIHPSL